MTADEKRLLRDAARRFDVEPRTETLARIERYLELLAVWNHRLRLTGERDPSRLIERHVADSLAPVRHLPSRGLVVDVGSGAGFPGIILACVCPDLEVVLVDSRRKPIAFLCDAIRSVPLPHARAVAARAEDAATDPELAGRAAVVVSRAIRADVFVTLAAAFLAPSGRAIAMQTPRTAGTATNAAERQGLALVGRDDYSLPGAGTRSLLIFGRDDARRVS